MNDSTRQKILKLHAQGLKYRDISFRVGVSRSTVMKVCNPEYAESARKSNIASKKRLRHPAMIDELGQPRKDGRFAKVDHTEFDRDMPYDRFLAES